MYMFCQLHTFCWKINQSKLSNLGSIGHILPRLSYFNHYVLCNMLPSFNCFGDLRVVKFWRTHSLCFLLSQDTLSGFSHCPLLSTHWAELWYWWMTVDLLLTYKSEGYHTLKTPIFSMIYRCFSFENSLGISSVLIFHIFSVFQQYQL